MGTVNGKARFSVALCLQMPGTWLVQFSLVQKAGKLCGMLKISSFSPSCMTIQIFYLNDSGKNSIL